MNLVRCFLCASCLAGTLAVLAAWTRPAAAQEVRQIPPASADGNYSGTDLEGNYQKALDAAIARAHDVLSHPEGKVISDYSFQWQVHSVTGTHGGFGGKRDVTVTIRVLR